MSVKEQLGKAGWLPQNLESLQGKTYLITGANSGVGFEAAKLLLVNDAKVVMLNRNANKSELAISDLKQELGDKIQLSYVITDLADLASIRRAVAEILDKVERIDALICNGAIAQIAKREITVDGFESQLGVNHYGHFLLSGLLFERIDRSDGRIVVVSSEGHKMGLRTIQFDDLNWQHNYHPNKAYSQSKLAQMMFAYELQKRIKAANKNVSVYVCHPGAANTSLIRDSANLVTRFSWWLMVKLGMAQSAEKGAYPEIMCATYEPLEQTAYYGPTGKMNFGGPVGECELESFVLEQSTMKRLWQNSELATAFNWSI